MGEWRIEGVPATFRIEEVVVAPPSTEAGPPNTQAPQSPDGSEIVSVDGETGAVDVAASAASPTEPAPATVQVLVIAFEDGSESHVFNGMIQPMQKLFNDALRARKGGTQTAWVPPPRTARAVPPAQQAAHAAQVLAENRQFAAERAAEASAAQPPHAAPPHVDPNAPPARPMTSAERAGLAPPRTTAARPIRQPQAAPHGHRPAPAAPSLARRPAGPVPNLVTPKR